MDEKQAHGLMAKAIHKLKVLMGLITPEIFSPMIHYESIGLMFD